MRRPSLTIQARLEQAAPVACGRAAGLWRATTMLDRASAVAYLGVGFALAFNLIWLRSEVSIRVPPLNDGVLHLQALDATVSALIHGRDPTDPWLASITLGFPLSHYYQHLPYVISAVPVVLTGGALGAGAVFDWTRYLLLSLFPLSVFWSMRRFGFDALTAGLAGLVSPILATDSLYGFDYGSYVWRGSGLYTQLWGMVLLPPALAYGYTAIRKGRSYFPAVLLGAATLLCHVVVGYVLLGSLTALTVLGGAWGETASHVRGDHLRRLTRLAIVLGMTAVATSYFLIPFLLDRAYVNRSVWETPTKYDAFGAAWTLNALAHGELFDHGRLPVLTGLCALGLLACLARWREERNRAPVILIVVWTLLYFGRTTWGVLVDLLPLGHELQAHRLIAGVHLAGIFLMGIGLALPLRWCLGGPGHGRLLVGVGLTTCLLWPAYQERAAYLDQNARWMTQSQQALRAEEHDLAALMARLRELPPGRVYAGLARAWGGAYRVGSVPMYALLNLAGFDCVGYLYHSLSLNTDIQVLFDDRRAEQYDLLNVRYVVAPADQDVPAFLRPIARFGRHQLYEMTTSGYFALVDSPVTFAGTRAGWFPVAAHWLGSTLPEAGIHPRLILDGALPAGSPPVPLTQAGARLAPSTSPAPTAEPRGTIVGEMVTEPSYQAVVSVTRASTLMLKSTFHPGWHAEIDGRPAEAMMVMPSMIGVNIDAGLHVVRLTYQSSRLRLALAVLGLAVTIGLAVVERRRPFLVASAIESLPMRGLRVAGRSLARSHAAAPIVELHRYLAPHLPYLVGLVLATLLAGLPLLQFKVMTGHDSLEYLPRNIEWHRAIATGQIIPRWAPDFSGGYGEPFFIFNPPVVYATTALFHVLGFSFIASENLTGLLLLLLASTGMYVLASAVFGRQGGFVSAIAYLFAPYVLVVLYVRHALADFAAFAFLPTALWGISTYAWDGRYRSLLIGATSVALLTLSSNPAALISAPALVLLACWPLSRRVTVPRLSRGLCCLALGLGAAAWFWVPALAERETVHVERLLDGYLNYRNHVAYAWQLVWSPWGYGLSLPGPGDGMSFSLGLLHLSLTVSALIGLRFVKPSPRSALTFFLAMVALGAFLATDLSLFIWDRLPLLHYLEFPWRFLSLAAVGTAFLCGWPWLLLGPRGGPLSNGLAVGLVGCIMLAGLPYAHPEGYYDVKEADFSPTAIAQRGIAVTTANEYEPIWVRDRPAAPAPGRASIVAGHGQVSVWERSPTDIELRVTATEASRLRLNTFYFPGWTLTVDGLPSAIERSNPEGVMEVWLDQGDHDLRLQFGTTPLRSWAQWTSALALLLLVGAAPVLRHAPRRWSSQSRLTFGVVPRPPLSDATFARLSVCLMIALVVVVLATFRDYGVVWDEEEHRLYGDFVVQWYATLFQDRFALSFWVLYLYGAFFELPARLAGLVLPFGLYENRHLVSAAFGVLGVVAAYKTAAHLAAPLAGLLAGLFLAVTPVYYGHLFVNPKDVPFAALHLLSLYAFFEAYDRLPRVPARLMVSIGVCVGAALGVRVGGVLLFGYLGLLVLAWLAAHRKAVNTLRPPLTSRTLPLISFMMAILIFSWAVMLAAWPWAQVSPILNPLRAVAATASFVAWQGTVFFNGETFTSLQVPRSYVPTWLAVSLPELYPIALATGIALAARACIRRGLPDCVSAQQVKIVVLVVAATLPVAAAAALRPVVYDGIRQFLFVVPPLAVLSGIAVAHLFRDPASPWVKALVGGSLFVSIVLTVADMARLHPYEYVYFNRSIGGGLQQAAARFETDYWGLSYREGMEWLIQNYRTGPGERVRVANCSRPFLTGYVLEQHPAAQERFETVAASARPDVLLATTRFQCQNRVPGRQLHIVERMGVPLLYVIEVAHPRES